jgi:phosphoglycolate phosphatase-like HAD superfamily hydrolase
VSLRPPPVTDPEARRRYAVVLFDVDGTLVDSNDAHAHAWVEALAEAGVAVSFSRVRAAIGMGGEKLLPEVAGISADSTQGERISTRRGEIFKNKYLATVKPFPDAGALVAEIVRRGFKAVAASSAKESELRALLKIAGAEALLDAATSSDDAERSKPDPDIIHVALRKVGMPPEQAVMIGDTPYDLKAASDAHVDSIAFRCGGWTDVELRGAVAIYDGPAHLLARLDETPMARADVGAGFSRPERP